MSKFVNDVRSSSTDPAYAGDVFQGTIAQVKKQLRAARDYGTPRAALNVAAKLHGISAGRYELLEFLRVLP